MSYEDIHHGRAYGLKPRPGCGTSATLAQSGNGSDNAIPWRYGLVIAFLILWQASSKLGWVNASVFPPLGPDHRRLVEGAFLGAHRR